MRRLAVGVVLCLCLVALVVGFGARFNGSPAYPDTAAIDADYAAHIGESVHLWTSVTAVEGGAVVVSTDSLTLRARGVDPATVDPGDGLQIAGTLEPGRVMAVEAADARPPGKSTFTYAVSAVGGLVAAAAMLRRWRVDLATWSFRPRG